MRDMYVTIVHGPTRPIAVYGPIDDRYPSAVPGLAQTATNLPLRPAGSIVGPGDLLSGIKRVGRATIRAIVNATPITGQAGPVVLFVVEPDARLVVAVGPMVTAMLANGWLRQRSGVKGDEYRCVPLPLAAPPAVGSGP